MDLKVLRYFLAVSREQSISSGAESLYLSQPTLSRQLKDLEDELGKKLFIRGNRKITLTEDGMLLCKRAEEILDLVKRTENEISVSSSIITGDVYIGSGETDAIRLIANVIKQLNKDYPSICYKISSGDAINVIDYLDKGLLDFGLLLNPVDISKYNYIKLNSKDIWGVIMLKNSPLAKKEFVSPNDLWDKPLIVSRQALDGSELSAWLKKDKSQLNIVATYNLIYNASILVDEGLGYAITLDKLINTSGDSNLCFKRLNPTLEIGMNIVWKKYKVFSKASEKFLEKLKELYG